MTKLDLKNQENTSPWESFHEYVAEFYQSGREELRQRLESEIQSEIDKFETGLKGARQIRVKNYHTPLGTIKVKRRAYERNNKWVCLVDEYLKLPESSWLPQVEKLASALGISHEFVHAQKLFSEWTNICVSDHGLANRVEKLGEELIKQEALEPVAEMVPMDSALRNRLKKEEEEKERIYVGVDGIMVSLREQPKGKSSYKEGKVGVLFWEKAHFNMSLKRKEIRQKEYIASMKSRDAFCELVFKRYSQLIQQEKVETIILGDGAKWIWEMSAMYFPQAIEILDFYHVSEYVWNVARTAWPEDEKSRKQWVRVQLKRLKKSQWQKVIKGLERFEKPWSALKESLNTLARYLENNAHRIDYKTYLEKGYMIGSGVVESSNRRIVTQRLKGAGMHWSERGANTIMTLRACYLSSSDKWDNFWKNKTA